MVHDIEERTNDDMDVDSEIEAAINEFEENGVPEAVLAFNLAKISDEERSRLFCRKF